MLQLSECAKRNSNSYALFTNSDQLSDYAKHNSNAYALFRNSDQLDIPGDSNKILDSDFLHQNL